MPAPPAKIDAAQALLDARDFAGARQAFQRLYLLEPGNPTVLYGLSRACSAVGDEPQAAFFAQRFAAAAGTQAQAMHLAGRLLIEVGAEKAAMEHLDRAVALHPQDLPIAMLMLKFLYYTRRTARAKALCRSLLESDTPGAPQWHAMLGALLRSEGRVTEAMDSLKRSVAGDPSSPQNRLQLAICSHYDARCGGADIAAFHRDFARAGGLADRPAVPLHAPIQQRGGPLRIGFLSPDFVTHSVAYFAEPLIEGLTARGVHTICYQTGNKEDETTSRFKACSRGFRSVWMLPQPELAHTIAADHLDILVDLAGLSLGGCIDGLHLRPAPVQINYLGYPASTGCAAHDQRIVDSATDPPGSEHLSTESLLRLDPCFLCYRPRADAPAPKDPSSASPPGSVTFASFNILTKVNDAVLDAWARILLAVPGSTLALKSNLLGEEGVREYFEGAFTQRGVPIDRLRLLSWTASPAEHLALYQGVDVALDPFPYNGTTTTCEALSMGIPVVTLEGDHHAARVGTSLLRAVGLPELIARDVDGYVALAAALAADEPRRQDLHARIPALFAASPLRDESGFCDRFLALLRSIPRVRNDS